MCSTAQFSRALPLPLAERLASINCRPVRRLDGIAEVSQNPSGVFGSVTYGGLQLHSPPRLPSGFYNFLPTRQGIYTAVMHEELNNVLHAWPEALTAQWKVQGTEIVGLGHP